MDLYTKILGGSKRDVLVKAGALILLIAVADAWSPGAVPLRLAYLLPLVMLGNVAGPFGLAAAAALCTILAEQFDELVWTPLEGGTRDLIYFTAYFGAGIFVYEVRRNRVASQRHLAEIAHQSEARREAEEQLKILIESSPAAIFMTDGTGRVLMANEAAHRLLGADTGKLAGESIHTYLPSLRNVAGEAGTQQSFRTVMQARGRRKDGEGFLADISFSTYSTEAGPRLAAMVLDASEELRTHEVSGLHQLMAASRIAISAVSHEIRNVCGAIAAVHQNLQHQSVLAGNKDFEALGSMVTALGRIANVDLRQSAHQASEVDLQGLLDELKIIVGPMLDEHDIDLSWSVDPALPHVWADRPSLMQVFLNLVTNSIRVVSVREQRQLCITARADTSCVAVEFADTGGGVAHPEELFRPFQDGAQATGLGLYLSRAFLRSFGGELRHVAKPEGACFIVSLATVA